VSKIPGPDRWVWRFVAGQPLDGHYRTDATFFRRGRKPLGKVEPRRWAYLAGAERLAARLAVLCGLPAVGWQYWTHPTRTAVVAAFLGLLGALWAVWRVRGAWVRRKLYRAYVKPLHAVLTPLLGLPATTRPADYITVPETHRTKEETPVAIELPKEFNPSPANKRLVADAAMSKFPAMNTDNTDAIFRTVGKPVLHLKMAPQPPDMVPWIDYREEIASLPPGKTFVGVGARSKPFIHNWNSGELVHVGVSVNTGGGKSYGICGWLAQELRKGATATYIDPKMSYLPEVLQGVPGYRLANNPRNPYEWWEEIFRLEREMDRRQELMHKDRTLEFPLMFLVLDELSEFADVSAQLWEEIKANPEAYGYDDIPKKAPNPVWRSLSILLRMGREFGVRVVVLTQRLDNKSTGGIGLRDLFGMRALGMFRKNQWMMLVGTTPIPKSVNKVGRWLYNNGERDVWVQNVYGEAEILRDWAFGDRRGNDTQAEHTVGDDASPGDSSASVKWDVKGNEAGAAYVGIPVGTFRKRRRDVGPIPGEEHEGRSPVWTYRALDEFFDTGRLNDTDPPPVATGEGRQ
jgi:hypothetical protein